MSSKLLSTESSCAKIIKLTQHWHGVYLQLQLQKKKKKKKKKRLFGRLGPTWQFRQTSKEKSQDRKFRMVAGTVILLLLLFTGKKTKVGGVDTGSVGLVETRVFFYAL